MGTVTELIRTHRAEILRTWTDAAQRATSAMHLTSPELASLMPEYLALLGSDAPAAESRPPAAQQALIERHLSNRLREGFNLNEILTEFAILGRCVSPFLQAEVEGDRPSVAEIASLYAELYQASTAVTRIFNEHVLEDEQAMKRYGRLLERMANEDPSVPLPERLSEALALIVGAMGARGATLLLYDGAGGPPSMTAAFGPGAEDLVRAAQALEATAYAGPSGATGTEAGGVAVPEALQPGVGALLRVRLSAHDRVRRVLYVSIEDQRPFSASEVRRLEGLGRALTIHLDNAHLRAALQRKERELQIERELRERIVSVLVREVRGPLALARSSVRHLGTVPPGFAASMLDVVDALGRIVQTVDEFLTTTPAMPHGAR